MLVKLKRDFSSKTGEGKKARYPLYFLYSALSLAEESIIRAHVDNALMFVDTLAEDMSFDRAIDTYVREMAIPEPLASVIATRTLVVLGQDLVPYRRRAVDGGEEADDDRPKLRLNDASQGRQPPGQRTIKRA